MIKLVQIKKFIITLAIFTLISFSFSTIGLGFGVRDGFSWWGSGWGYRYTVFVESGLPGNGNHPHEC